MSVRYQMTPALKSQGQYSKAEETCISRHLVNMDFTKILQQLYKVSRASTLEC